MKRTIVVMIFLTAAAMAFAQNPEAVIREITGTVELKTSGSEIWRPASAGDRIEKSTVISTSFKSIAVLAVGSSTLTVRPLTRLSLQELVSQDNTETLNVDLRAGRVRVDVKPPAGSRANVTVQTPSSTASVRGTVFDIDPVSLRVHEGSVSYRAAGENARPVMVSEGQSSQVDTASGKTVNPYAQAEAARALPALPGMSSTPVVESSARPKNAQGSLDINVGIVWGNE
ncbi:MAG: FecR domain-containing protein [Treponema sp.]|jgi:hypothetical protein|nr:FecR domain-containing protein [Treponema sp.]